MTAEMNSAYDNSPLCSELTRDLPRTAAVRGVRGPFDFIITAEVNSAYGNSPLRSELTRDLPRAAPGGLFSSLSAPLYSKLHGVIR